MNWKPADIAMVKTIARGSGGGGGGGVTPNVQATAETLPAGSEATVTRTGSDANPVFHFGIPEGPAGPGIATDGATGSILTKSSAADYDTAWIDLSQVGAELVKPGNPVGAALSNKAAKSTQQTVEKAVASNRTVEVAAGIVLNCWLGLGIWDYSGLWGNLWGQICPQFTALWCLLAGPVIVVFDWLDYWLCAGDRPYYRLI